MYIYVLCILLFSALQVQMYTSYHIHDLTIRGSTAGSAVFGLFAEVMHEMRSPGHHVLQNNPHR